jgi:hypothetical protein
LLASSLIELLMGGVLLAASVVALGPPDVALAGQFLSGSYPSVPSAVACLSLLSYVAVIGVAAVAVMGGAHAARRRVPSGRAVRAIAFIVAGAVLLSLSVANREQGEGSICCGGGSRHVQEVSSLVR